jgi:cellobiose-specific phosphotransferase system component IIB
MADKVIALACAAGMSTSLWFCATFEDSCTKIVI